MKKYLKRLRLAWDVLTGKKYASKWPVRKDKGDA